jgi:hypothetical protein
LPQGDVVSSSEHSALFMGRGNLTMHYTRVSLD